MDSTESVGSLPRAFGRYRVEKVLGEGAMGTVYLARDSQLDRRVALKIPKFGDNGDSELLERFYREARAAATLRHPHICPVYDVGEVDGTLYLSMAYIEGRTLSKYVNREKSQSERQAAGVVRKLASALDHAHQQGVVHRDLKPANIMIDKRNDPIVMDFGLARRLELAGDRLTQTGTILGTPAYMSPEQVRAEWENVGPPSDIYSLGVILYELLTGELPFDGPIGVVMALVLTQEPEKPSTFRPDLDPRLEAVCLKMMAKEISDRYGSMREAATALSAFLKNKGQPQNKGQQPDDALQPFFQAVALDSPPRRDTVESEVQRRTLVGRETPTSTSQIVQSVSGLRGTVQSTSVKFSSAVARLPGWAKGAIGAVVVMLLIYSISLPFRAERKPVTDVRNSDSPVAAATDPPSAAEVPLTPVVSEPPSPTKAPFTSVQAKAHQKAWAKHLAIDLETTNSIGMKMLLIPPGEFTMGSPDSDTVANGREKPQHPVKITKPYYLSMHEVTQRQYETVMETRPWQGRMNVQEGPDYPATYVSWNDAMEFCRKLSAQEGVEYRLPTEAEWEYACRAGATTAYSFGNAASKLGQYAWYNKSTVDTGEKYAHRVGQKLPNPWGLYDMHGNVWEWCQDWYGSYGSEEVSDPMGPAQGESRRVLRGGSFFVQPSLVRSANRSYDRPTYRNNDIGFRPSRTYR